MFWKNAITKHRGTQKFRNVNSSSKRILSWRKKIQKTSVSSTRFKLKKKKWLILRFWKNAISKHENTRILSPKLDNQILEGFCFEYKRTRRIPLVLKDWHYNRWHLIRILEAIGKYRLTQKFHDLNWTKF